MDTGTQSSAFIYFIQPFLSQHKNSGIDCTLPLNNSVDFIVKNLGSFFPFAQLQYISSLSSNFSAVEALPVLTLVQLDELVFSPPARPEDRANILTRVFDFLLQTPNREKLVDFIVKNFGSFSPFAQLQYFHNLSSNFSAVEALPVLTLAQLDELVFSPPAKPEDRANILTRVFDFLLQTPNREKLYNIVIGLQTEARMANFSCENYKVIFDRIDQTLSSASPNQTEDLLMIRDTIMMIPPDGIDCTLPFINSVDFIVKNFGSFSSSAMLQYFSSLNGHFSAVEALPVLTLAQLDELVFSPPARPEERANILTRVFDFLLQTPNREKLKSFLPNLQTEARKANFSCENYKVIFDRIDQTLSSASPNQTEDLLMIRDEIMMIPPDGIDCTLPFINSVDFIVKNFGSFSPFAQLQYFHNLSSHFSAVEALPVLTLVQLDELVFSPPARPEDRANILTRVFDFLLQTPNREKLYNIVIGLQTEARMVFDRIDQTLSSASPNQTEDLLMIRDEIMMIPPDGIDCTLPFNNSVDFIVKNFGSFSPFAQLQYFHNLSSNFSAVEALPVLTLAQLHELVFSPPAKPEDRANILTRVFDFLLQTPNREKLYNIVIGLQTEARMANFSCENYKVIFDRIDQTLSSASPNQTEDLLMIRDTIMMIPPDVCIERSSQTLVIPQQDICISPEASATQKQALIYRVFVKSFLLRSDIDDPQCLKDAATSVQWVTKNFGSFVQVANLTDLATLNSNFKAADVLPLLSLNQLVEFSLTPGALVNSQTSINVMQVVKDCQLATFFDLFSPKVKDNLLSTDVKTALIQQIFDRANLSSIPNVQVQVWFQTRLQPLLPNFSESLVPSFFSILNSRDCETSHSVLKLLGSLSSLPTNTKDAIYKYILLSFGGTQPLKCYQSNSFIIYLSDSLSSFGPLPNLTTVLSLMPPSRKSELINSISPTELGAYLRQTDVMNDYSQICTIYDSFTKTTDFLENVDVPDNIKSNIFPCVWPMALNSDNQTEIDLWFDKRFKFYLKFLNKDLLGSQSTLGSSCLSYKKMVKVLGTSFNFNGSQISSADVYSTIKTYLKADSVPKCYNPTDTGPDSTAWFANYIGTFMSWLTLDDLYTFGSESNIQIFTVNLANIQLFNQIALPKNLTTYYTQLIFNQNPNFNLFNLPLTLQCGAPASTFTTLNETQTSTLLGFFKTSCTDLDPAISTALAANIQTIDSSTISTLGTEVTGLSTAQINSAPPEVLINNLQTLTAVSDWDLGQAKAIVNVLLSGSFEVTNPTKLVSLGPLITGIPSTVLANIDPSQMVSISQDTTFVKNIMAAPEIVQKTFVTQAALFFDTVANVFDQPDDLSVEVLQGFTCSRVQTFTQTKVKGLIKACRRRANRATVVLSETQLTCMYNFVRSDVAVDFSSFPPEMLLYYDYATISSTMCKDYFTALGAADLTVLSSALSGRRDTLWNNALDCLGIKGVSIKKEDLKILGNLPVHYKLRSRNPGEFEELQGPLGFSNASNGKSSHGGSKSKWNQKTLNDLGNLPLYFSQNFWGSFRQTDLSIFFKGFLKFVRGNTVSKSHQKRLFKAILVPVKRSKRAASDCTVGNISSVTISDDAFPFGYDASQFRNCLSAQVVKDNLGSLCAKIEDNNFQRVILDKLQEILPSGLSDDQVQLLKSVSRNATVDEIKKWSITKPDTLAALMNANDGTWSSEQSNQIITKYLSAGNNLTTTVLNLVKGPNLCSLTTSQLSTILPDSMRGSDALDVSTCSAANKKMLFSIAKQAFPMTTTSDTRSTLSAFQLIESYLGGADLDYVRSLSSYNISMSVSTFTNLDTTVVNSLTVSDVVGLLGKNLQDLKTFENQTLVRSWITSQLQSDLDKLGIGIGHTVPLSILMLILSTIKVAFL
ncbi:hypothetical protein DNTS_003240 [Danionella cerebrum]|uniref:Mesothelin-like protein n=1 Tax=Danionella cerebrum TaxID=2873325 RepID=A0A553RQ30_9TELE|nr:hypothetical protein DNTS_003240 [Danionella translucida]